MAQNLMERLKAAMSPRARVADTETLLADLKAEQGRLTVARDQAAADSVDFALNEDDREEAAAKASRLDRTIKGLDTEIAKVAALLAERRSDDARKAAEAEKRAALTERDEIAAQFADRVPAITGELIELFKAIQANAERMRMAGLHEANAEMHARGVPAHGRLGNSPVMQFCELKIPEFSSAGRAWPFDWRAAEAKTNFARETADWQKHLADEERQKREKAEAAAKFAREHARYRIEVEIGGEFGDSVAHVPEELVSGDMPAAMGPWDRRELVLRHEVAAALGRVPRFKVTRLDAEAAQ